MNYPILTCPNCNDDMDCFYNEIRDEKFRYWHCSRCRQRFELRGV